MSSSSYAIKYLPIPELGNPGSDDCSRLRKSCFKSVVIATLFFVGCGAAASRSSPPLSADQKLMVEVQKKISAASTMIFKFQSSSVCGSVEYRVTGSALVEFANTLDRLIAGPGVIESPSMVLIDIYHGEELVEELQMLEYRMVRHRRADADMSFFAVAKIVQWFKSQSIPIRCLDFDDE